MKHLKFHHKKKYRPMKHFKVYFTFRENTKRLGSLLVIYNKRRNSSYGDQQVIIPHDWIYNNFQEKNTCSVVLIEKGKAPRYELSNKTSYDYYAYQEKTFIHLLQNG